MNYSKCIDDLDKFIDYEKKYTHKKDYRIKEFSDFLSYINSPERYGKSILIAGTKGKGSTVNYISSALIKMGYDVGSFYSPHIKDIRERICYNNKLIPKKNFTAIYSYLISKFSNKDRSYKTFFEIMTSIAFLYFQKKNTDFNIVEVGLGGRLDSTNVLPNRYAIITHIGLDHTEVLGNTIEKIAYEKSGIIKPGSTVITGFQRNEVLNIIKDTAYRLGAKLYIIEDHIKDIEYSITESNVTFEFNNKSFSLKSKMLGFHQKDNMLNAFMLLKIMESRNEIHRVENGNIFENAFIQGRFEIRKIKDNTFILDGAHNKDAMETLVQNVESLFKGKIINLIFTCMGNKDYKGMINELRNLKIRNIYIDNLNNPRELDTNSIIKTFRANGFNNIFSKISLSSINSSENEIFLITGSFYLVAKWEFILDKLN